MRQTLCIYCLLVGLTSCTTFEKARRKFATNVVDTTYTTIQTVVPRDSAVLRIVTDTTTVVHEIRQGRARIIYQRNPEVTTIRADCDSVIVEKKVPQYITKQVWGIDPDYKKYKALFFGLLAAVVLTCLVLYILSRFSFSVQKKVKR